MVRPTTNKTDVFHLLHNLKFGHATDARVTAIGTCNSSRVSLGIRRVLIRSDTNTRWPDPSLHRLYDEDTVSQHFLISPVFTTGFSFLHKKFGPDPRLHNDMHPYASRLDDTKTEQWNTGR